MYINSARAQGHVNTLICTFGPVPRKVKDTFPDNSAFSSDNKLVPAVFLLMSLSPLSTSPHKALSQFFTSGNNEQ